MGVMWQAFSHIINNSIVLEMDVARGFGSEESPSGRGWRLGQSQSIWPELKHSLDAGLKHNYKHAYFNAILIISFL